MYFDPLSKRLRIFYPDNKYEFKMTYILTLKEVQAG